MFVKKLPVKLIGKGGHASSPELARDPLQAAVEILTENRKILQKFQKEIENKTFVCTLPYLKAGEAPNAIPEHATLRGTMRTLKEELTLEYNSLLHEMCERVCNKRGITLDLKIDVYYPVVDNSLKQTEIVTEIAKQVYGEENVSSEHLPLLASEDFSYYLKEAPGTFFFPASGKASTNYSGLHTATYDFDDDAIEKASEMFYRIALHRFGLNLDT